jgi:hypothetical protein
LDVHLLGRIGIASADRATDFTDKPQLAALFARLVVAEARIVSQRQLIGERRW